MPNLAIKAEGISKKYRLGAGAAAYGRLTESLTDLVTSPFRRLLGSEKERQGKRDLWALKDVSFEVNEGEAVGIIGRNGAGKSTLLKVLSRISEPTEGTARINGRVGSLLEVGTGFHPELTGMENIFLNGAILGMGKAEIKRKMDDILEFAEVEDFLDTPVKRYSSGMQVRLAFAVAAHLEPDILIVDEVLAVGDVAFQKKCLGKMGDVTGEGRTVLFVSHNMGVVGRLCTKGILMDQGKTLAQGNMEDVIAQYLSTGVGRAEYLVDDPAEAPGNDVISLRAVRLRNKEGVIASSFDARQPMCVEIEYDVLKSRPLRTAFRLISAEGTVLFTSTDGDDATTMGVDRPEGRFISRCQIPSRLLKRGQYSISVSSSIPMVKVNFSVDNALTFSVDHTDGLIEDNRPGVIAPALSWSVERVS